MKKYRLMIQDQEKYPIVIKSAQKFPIVFKQEDKYKIVVEGLFTTVRLAGKPINMTLIQSGADLIVEHIFHPTEGIMTIEAALAALPALSLYIAECPENAFTIDCSVPLGGTVIMDADEHLFAIENPVTSMAITIPTYVADWTDYYLSDLQDMTIENMIYTEVV